ncbi:uncharacterized protein LOC105925918 isoform X1 [Fundulus heteroclitus]|uniref:uncharacterized protein LOC105925918 isoform X1 n=1 Tax=Fundulus heteroclitus TaxID=8078 RepID=UPI00165A4479|nr:uncharacterized protein LOC105925918 isoform X1 [Fundulus heteroclitus]
MRSEMAIIWAVVVAVCCVLHQSKAETLQCTVSQNGDMTTFTILDGSRGSDVNLTACDFEWINGSNILIADNSNHVPPVMEWSVNSLTTSLCVEGIISKQYCPSTVTEFWIEYITNCTVTCKDLKDHGEQQKDQEEEGQSKHIVKLTTANPCGWSMFWIVAGVAAVAVVVLAGLYLCYKFRDYIWKTRGCSQCEGRYTNVKLQSIQPKLLDV